MGEQSRRVPLSSRAFAEVLQITQSDVQAFVRHLVASSDDARDLTQDVYVRAWRASQRGDPPFAMDTSLPGGALDMTGIRRWLFHVAYRQAITLLRHRSLIPWISLDSDDEEGGAAPLGHRDAEPFEDRVVEAAVLEAALARLKPDDVAGLLLAVVHGFSTAEIARTLGIAPDAARKRLSRAMERLRAAYFEQEPATKHVRRGMGK